MVVCGLAVGAMAAREALVPRGERGASEVSVDPVVRAETAARAVTHYLLLNLAKMAALGRLVNQVNRDRRGQTACPRLPPGRPASRGMVTRREQEASAARGGRIPVAREKEALVRPLLGRVALPKPGEPLETGAEEAPPT